MKNILISILSLVSFCAIPLCAQESCYEQYFREQGKEILLSTDESDNSYDELKKEVIARQVLRGETPYAQYIKDRYEPPTAKYGVPSQVLHKPLVLAIDTVTGVCHLLAEDGTILAEARIAMVDSTWYMWLSVDPLADKNISSSPYMYCNGNPIMLIDPDGRDWYDSGDGYITWNDKATSQEAMNQANINGIYLGKNVLVGKHGRDENLKEEINGAVFELYLEKYKDGPVATINGNTIPCDVDKYGTLKEGRYPAKYSEYHGRPAILINEGGDLPTIKGNPNNKNNYTDYWKKIMKPLEEHIMDQIFFHYGNNYFESLQDSKGKPWTTGCQTGGNYKGAWMDYNAFMQNVPTTFNGWYYLRSK